LSWELLWEGQEDQATDGGERALLHKEIRILHGEAPLGLVRKHLPGGATKPAVVLVHGFAQNRYTWHCSTRSPSAWLAARGFDVWNLELRGHGRSRRDGGRGAERFQSYVDDMVHLARELPGPAYWMGHSLGGAAIYGAAATMRPLRCLGVIGIAAVYRFAQENRFMNLLCRATHRLARHPVLGQIEVKTRMGGNLLSSLYGISDVAGYTLPISGWWPGSIEPDLLRERLARGFDWTSVEVWKEMSRWAAQGHFDYEEQWAGTDVPLLVLLGDEDHLLPPSDGKEAYLQSGSRDKEMVVFDNYLHESHWGHLDLILGKRARKHVWSYAADWMEKRHPNPPEA
jgi:polyhydroxyalkanoate synthase subunit PhaC